MKRKNNYAENHKEINFSIRFIDEEMKEIRDAAKECSCSMGFLVRFCLRSALPSAKDFLLCGCDINYPKI